jgi:hypothetical protein
MNLVDCILFATQIVMMRIDLVTDQGLFFKGHARSKARQLATTVVFIP